MPKILYVDDEDDIREIAEMALGLDPSFEIRSAASGREGLEVARCFSPDLIMLDVMMPGMDGPSTFSAARADPDLGHVPVVFITARTQTHQVAELMALGARGVIPKPFDPMTLAAQVSRLLDDEGNR
ncbi:response regulator [Mesorhizobium sp. YIM 152430]|uniref:response regulator n=1 Tax=Mesorhizobium sp. YIM 152430 TaxID=3031761 RepID=UPI0023DB9F03|nr:response regulator [Mesorhizobium sp. YIM 152430]MDF1600816.1 response regulator [Mesorhizobium sp. YIM 152430]